MKHEGIMGIKELDKIIKERSKEYTTFNYSGMTSEPTGTKNGNEYSHGSGHWEWLFIPVGEDLYLKFYCEGKK